MPGLANLVRVQSATTGTGTLTLAAAVTGFLTPTQAGMTSGATYSYAIEADYTIVGDDSVSVSREVGTGVWTSGADTLTRSVINSTNGNALLNLAGDEQVIITLISTSAGDFSILGTTGSSSKTTGALVVAGGIGCSQNIHANQGHFTNTAGNGGEQVIGGATTQTTVNSGDNGDSAVGVTYTLSAVSASNQLITRTFLYDFTNNLTGGGAITNGRIVNIRGFTNASTTTTTLSHVYIENTNSGTTTNVVGLHIGQLQGTNIYGIKDDVTGSIWAHAGTTSSTSDTTGALVVTGGVGIHGELNVGGQINLRSNTATPAGGSVVARILLGTTSGFGIYYGSGAPTVSAAAGSLYIRTDNAGASLRLYSNTTGSTTWAAITSA